MGKCYLMWYHRVRTDGNVIMTILSPHESLYIPIHILRLKR